MRRGLNKVAALLDARLTRVALVALFPLLIVAFAPAIFGWHVVSPGPSASSEQLREAVKIIGELSMDMSSIAVAILVGLAILARERAKRKISRGFLMTTLGCAFFAILSVYASIRLRVGVAVQMIGGESYFDILLEQLLGQIFALAIGLSLLVAVAASAIFGSERSR